MHEPTHAPGWRGRPPYYGDLQGQHDEADRLERLAVAGCAFMAGGTAIAVAIMFLLEYAKGHL